jgi:hypothetical protein
MPTNLLFRLIYDATTGEIVGTCLQGRDGPFDDQPGRAHIAFEAEDMPDGTASVLAQGYYVDLSGAAPAMAARPIMSISLDKTSVVANGTDEATFTGVPVGATVRIDGGETFPMLNETLLFSSDTVGTYKVTFSSWPHVDASFTIEATAP